MNDSNLNYSNNGNGIYRATGNMNTTMENLNSNNINNATSVNVLGPEYSVGSSYDLNSGVNNFSQVLPNSLNGFDQNVSNGFAQGSVNGGNGFTQNVDVNNFSVNQTILDNGNFNSVDNNSYSNQDNLNQYMGLDSNQSNSNKFIINPNNNSGSSFLGGGFINPQAIANNDSSVYMGGDAITTTKKVKYEPILETNNKPSNNSNNNNGSSKDTIVVIVITLILLLCIWFIPVIYDLIIGIINLS